MELDQLRHFLKVAEYGNFTRAAEDVKLSQPALSRSIARLEVELGQPLFERQTRSVSLTDSGTLLLDRARQILNLVDDTKAQLIDDGQTGRVRVGAIPTIAPYFLPERLKAFHKKFPKSHIAVFEDTTDILLKKLKDGLVDIVFAALPIDTKYVKVEKLFEEELLLVMSANSPLAKKSAIQMRDIEQLPFILLGEAHCLSDSIVSFCRQNSFHPLTVERISQLATVQELVALNHGVSLIPCMAAERDSSSRRVYRPLKGKTPSRSIVMVSNPYRYLSLLQDNFQKFIRGFGTAPCHTKSLSQ
jgi:LysR family transcriptional regulator, hydrogen peroxide-inducible genes activator